MWPGHCSEVSVPIAAAWHRVYRETWMGTHVHHRGADRPGGALPAQYPPAARQRTCHSAQSRSEPSVVLGARRCTTPGLVPLGHTHLYTHTQLRWGGGRHRAGAPSSSAAVWPGADMRFCPMAPLQGPGVQSQVGGRKQSPSWKTGSGRGLARSHVPAGAARGRGDGWAVTGGGRLSRGGGGGAGRLGSSESEA